jgi:hypothetical protein
MQPTLHMAVLRRAAEILGSVEGLALYLKESKLRVDIWTSGVLPTPDRIFLKLVDLLSDDSPPPGAKQEDGD